MTSDVDPDPVGSAFIWVRGFGFLMRIQRYNMKGKVQQTNFRRVFRRKKYFFMSETKKSS